MKILAKLFIFFFLSHCLIINFADSKCQESFQCGNLGYLEFPLSDYTKPDCGLFMVDCNSFSPRVQLEDGGRWYEILQKLSANKFRIRNPIFEDYLSSLTCNPITSLFLPNSHSSSFTVFPNLTFFQCPKSYPQYDDLIYDYFRAGNYTDLDCSSFRMYYRYSGYSSLDEEVATPQTCSVFQLPLQISPGSDSWGSQNFQIVNAEFDLEWNVSNACLECYRRGGRCQTITSDGFGCALELGDNRKLRKVLVTGGVSVTAFLATSTVLFILFQKKYMLIAKWFGVGKAKTGKENDIERAILNLAQKRYKYSHLKKMTNSFSDKLGEGGYGSVYKGKLADGRLVAVKILNESKGNGEEFINEVASISRTSHINIVALLGFCYEGSKRALVYEFLQNGSLDKFIHNPAGSTSAGYQLGWEKLFEIAVGIAQGLDYLHQGCNTRILHFDIKPHNILLDKDLRPKISDFGLAKLCPNRSSIVSMVAARGTIGYIAPEVF